MAAQVEPGGGRGMGVEIHDGITVRISRAFDCPPERLFAAFTEPDLASQWTWPGDERAMRGVYLEIEPNRRLVYTLHWDADVGYNRPCIESIDEAVIVDFRETATGCSLSFTQVGLPGDAKSAEAHAQGVQASFDVLTAVLDEQT